MNAKKLGSTSYGARAQLGHNVNTDGTTGTSVTSWVVENGIHNVSSSKPNRANKVWYIGKDYKMAEAAFKTASAWK